MRTSMILHKIKVRHAVIFLLFILFVLLILSHHVIEDPDELGRGLKPAPLRKKDVEFSELPNRQTLDRVKLNLTYEMVGSRETQLQQDRSQVFKNIQQKAAYKTQTDNDGNILEHKGAHEYLYDKASLDKSQIGHNFSANNVSSLDNLAFNPKILFDDNMKRLLNKTIKGQYSYMDRLSGSNRTRKNSPLLTMNKDLDNPSKTLNLRFINNNVSHLVNYKKEEAVIWVTGHPRSGTTLMRVMLDAHQDVRCGEETHIIPRILSTHSQMMRSDARMGRLTEANIDNSVIEEALGAYIMTVIAKHGEPANRLCNKDPFTISYSSVIRNILPNSKFLFMVRDGRAVTHSVITRKVTIQGFDMSSHMNGLRSWNTMMSRMVRSCRELGPETCLPVYYEQLVLHPRAQMKRILSFLDIPWDEMVLHHEQTVGKKGGVSLSMREFSTDQVEKPVNMMSLTSWLEHFPEASRQQVKDAAPLLESLGYDVDTYPPTYGEPDPDILKNTREVEKRRQLKRGNSTESAVPPPQHKQRVFDLMKKHAKAADPAA